MERYILQVAMLVPRRSTSLRRLPGGVLSDELLNIFSSLQTSTEALNNRLTTGIIGIVHPSRVSDMIAKAIIELIAPVYALLIRVGIKEAQEIAAAWQRVIATDNPSDPLQSDLRRILMAADPKHLMALLGKDARPAILAAAVDVLDLLSLPTGFDIDVIRRHAIAQVIRRHAVAPDAARTPSPAEPFAHGVDPDKAIALAEKLIERHNARTEAVEQIESTARHLVAALAVLSERPVDQVWEMIK